MRGKKRANQNAWVGALKAVMKDEDRPLVARLRRGERAAFGAVLDAHYAAIYQKLLYLAGGNREQAADLTQLTFIAAWKSLPTFRGRAKLSTWLHTIAVRTWHASLRTAPPDTHEKELAELPDVAVSVEIQVVTALEIERLHCAILHLPRLYRSVVVLAHLDQYTHPEIAELLDIPVGTVKSRLHTALAHLRRALVDPREEKP